MSVAGSEINHAARALGRGELVAFATETVYGLGADARSDRAVARIFAAKARPRFNPLIVHVADLAAARQLGVFNDTALLLADALWPGALSLVVPKRQDAGLCALATAGLDTVALRVPAHETAQRLLNAAKMPVAAPSANPSGRLSPTSAAHVRDALADKVAVILDGGEAAIGVESTIIACESDPPRLLRAGGIARSDISAILGYQIGDGEADPAKPGAPGQLASHYAPRARLRLDALTAGAGEALLAFGRDAPAANGPARNLSPAGDLNEAAANLFRHLHDLDATGVSVIAVMPVPDSGLGEAINDRLRRAAAPREARGGSPKA